jgi:hypothetical protein
MQLETRIRILIDENRKLNSTLKDKLNEIEDQRIKISEYEILIHNLTNQDGEIQRLHEIINAK